MARPVVATIDLAALAHNLAVVKRHAPAARVLAVVKANAYGHGLARATRALAGADGFGLIELDSAVRLREAGYAQPILLLEGAFEPSELPVLAHHRIATVVHCREQVAMLKDLPGNAALDVFVKVNTGMNRLGFEPGAISGVVAELRRLASVGNLTLMTHFASADEARGVAWQMEILERAQQVPALPLSLANSAAILRHPAAHAGWVRPGIMLYGCSPFAEGTAADLDLQPVMTLESRVIAVQNMKRGDILGYGGLFEADRDTRVGVIACGYADGYPRHAPNGTPLMVEGRMTRTLGRVSMDMLCADLSGLPEAGTGSRAVLWGADVPVERVAAAAGTVGYQLLCALAPRVRIAEV
ncbi:MAG TPA: alanine racemase [Burkholderiales bacterium]|jgi:alanine racemase|nr:alanine racemase [Burkholderiales bacterium]